MAGVFVATGVGVGGAAPYVIEGGLAQSWLPFEGARAPLDQLDRRFGSWLLTLVGGLAGVVLGFLTAADEGPRSARETSHGTRAA